MKGCVFAAAIAADDRNKLKLVAVPILVVIKPVLKFLLVVDVLTQQRVVCLRINDIHHGYIPHGQNESGLLSLQGLGGR